MCGGRTAWASPQGKLLFAPHPLLFIPPHPYPLSPPTSPLQPSQGPQRLSTQGELLSAPHPPVLPAPSCPLQTLLFIPHPPHPLSCSSPSPPHPPAAQPGAAAILTAGRVLVPRLPVVPTEPLPGRGAVISIPACFTPASFQLPDALTFSPAEERGLSIVTQG